MWRVLNNEETHREMREKGLRQAGRFSWERAARETLQIYRTVYEN
jgi:glycosyltransferase involved in cell wall biosynthesis